MLIDVAFVIIGLIVLFIGGETTVRGSVSLARTLGISTVMIGLIVIGLGTSAPELFVTVGASLGGKPDIGVGNIVGSNIANILLVLGIGALIFPLTFESKEIKRDGVAMLIAALLLVYLLTKGRIGLLDGSLMVSTLAMFLCWLYFHDRDQQYAAAELGSDVTTDRLAGGIRITSFIIGGLIFLIGGAALVVNGATGIARSLGVSESVIGLSLVAIGTSLPEVAATSVAALKRQTDVAIAGILGSNLFNVFGILGVAAIIKPLPVADDIASIDIWVMLASAMLIIPIMILGRISRVGGALLLFIYIIYILSMASRLT